MKKPLLDHCLDILETMSVRMGTYDAANEGINEAFKGLNSLVDDFMSINIPAIDEDISNAIILMIDDVLEDATSYHTLGSYWLYECQYMNKGGKIIEENGDEYPLTDIDSLRALVKARSV